MLSLADRIELRKLGADREQGDVRVPEAEGRQALELPAEPERQLVAAHDGVDRRHRRQLLRRQHARSVLGERLREGFDVLRRDREPGGRAVSSPAAEQMRACAQRTVEIGSARELAEAWRQAVLAKGGFTELETVDE